MGFWVQIRPEVLNKLREDYPPGAKVELIEMISEPKKDMVPGMRGEVLFVDDAGQAHIRWENNSTLACMHGIDRFHKVDG